MDIHDEAWYAWILGGYLSLVVITYGACSLITAPYGKHVSIGWGPTWGVRKCWILMESPALWAMQAFYSTGKNKSGRVPLFLLTVHQIHYFNRVLIYPVRMKGARGKRMPLLVALCAITFNILNSYVQARWIAHYGNYLDEWMSRPSFVLGTMIFFLGLAGNVWSDDIMMSLRSDDRDQSYKIPQGGLFRFVTNANYFSEMVEWLGWAILTWSYAGLAFFLYTVANLAPRAKSTHQWYLQRFSEYPKDRKILIPFLY